MIVFVLTWAVGALQRRLPVRLLLPGVGAITVALALTTAEMAPFLVQRAPLDRAERAAASRELDFDSQYRLYSAGGLALLAQPRKGTLPLPGADLLRTGSLDIVNVAESTVFPGWLLLSVLVCFALLRSRLRWPLLAAAL